jgi:hypothetical protein
MPHRGALSTKSLGVEGVAASGPGRSRREVPASGGKRERAASDRLITQSAAALGNLFGYSDALLLRALGLQQVERLAQRLIPLGSSCLIVVVRDRLAHGHVGGNRVVFTEAPGRGRKCDPNDRPSLPLHTHGKDSCWIVTLFLNCWPIEPLLG